MAVTQQRKKKLKGGMMVERQRPVGSVERSRREQLSGGTPPPPCVANMCVSRCLPFPWRHLLQVGGEAVVCPRAASAHT